MNNAEARELQRQAVFSQMWRLIYGILAALPLFTLTIEPGSNGAVWHSFAVALVAGEFLTAPLVVLVSRTNRWAVTAATISLCYDALTVMTIAHTANGITSVLLILLLINIVGAGSDLRRAVPLLPVIAVFNAAVFLLFFIAEYVPGFLDGSLQVQGVALGANTNIVYAVVFLLSIASITALTSVFSISNRQLLKQTQQQAQELTATNATLSQSISSQSRIAGQLSTAAAELAANAEAQATNATEQSTSIMEVSVTIEQLSRTAQQIAEASAAVSRAAEQAMQNASEGQEAVRDSIIGMALIRGRVNDITSRILTLSGRAQQIGEVIDVINEIAAQTHLLALNASIEAAEAATEGRRFAVVAAEVKKLAQRASSAVREVRSLVVELQAASNTAVMATEDGMKETEKGVHLAHSSGDANEEIIQVVDRTSQLATAISLATQQQRSASAQVATTMREIAAISSRATQSSHQAAATASLVSDLAAHLRSLQASPQPLPPPTSGQQGEDQPRLVAKSAA